MSAAPAAMDALVVTHLHGACEREMHRATFEFVVEFVTQYVLRKDTAGDTLSFLAMHCFAFNA